MSKFKDWLYDNGALVAGLWFTALATAMIGTLIYHVFKCGCEL
jgi:hypothetical protein